MRADLDAFPEFAMLETYQAWGTYDDSAVMTRELVQEVADEAIGTRQVLLADGTVYDLDGEWQALQMHPSLSEALGEEISAGNFGGRSLHRRPGAWVSRSPRPRLRPWKTRRGTVGAHGRRRIVGADLREGLSGRDQFR